MRTLFAIVACAIAIPAFAQTQEAKPAPSIPNVSLDIKPEPHKLTVGELINIGNALASIDVHATPGSPQPVPAGFKFAGVTRMKFATIVDISRGQLKTYQETVAHLQRGIKTDKDGKPDPTEQRAFEAEREKMFNAPVEYITVPRIRAAELCLDAKPPECPVQNDIPVGVLGILFPIIDQ